MIELSDLDFSFGADFKAEIVAMRPLRATDLELSGPTVVAQPVVKIRSRHHALAQLLAEGRSNTEAGLLTGYSASRISILKADPAFAELLAHYSEQQQQAYVNVHERLAALGINAVEELQERLELNPEEFSKKELMEVASLALDRAGFGPKTTVQHSGSIGIVTPEVLVAIKGELARRRAPRIEKEDLLELTAEAEPEEKEK